MAKFCERCGHPLGNTMTFCDKCGHKAATAPAQPQRTPVQPVQVRPQASQPAVPTYAPPPKKSRTGLFLGLGLGAVVIIVIVLAGLGVGAYFAFAPQPVKLTAFPEELQVDPDKVTVHCQYNAPAEIIPANYRSMDYVVYMQCWTDRGRTKVMVTVEIPEFTQKYEQMVEVSRAETEIIIHPPLLDNAAKSLKSSKEAQLVVSVKDMNSGEIWVQESKPVKLFSRNDIQWAGADGTPYDENILAWVTPEAPEIDKMLRDTADSLSELTGGDMTSVVGYQQVGKYEQWFITYAQVCSMMYTLADEYKVKYVMAPFSATGSQMQSVKTPAQVISTKGGLCVETAVTMASAIQRTNMHAVIILLPGHAQVAVETWNNSGEYLLIETTALDAAAQSSFDSVVTYMTKDEWAQYMGQEGYVAIDCDLAEQLHIKSID